MLFVTEGHSITPYLWAVSERDLRVSDNKQLTSMLQHTAI